MKTKCYYCEICDVESNSITTLRSHFEGAKHKKKVELVGLDNSLKNDPEDAEIWNKLVQCTLCNVMLLGADCMLHTHGPLHQKRLSAMSREDQKKYSKVSTCFQEMWTNLDPSEGETFSCETCQLQFVDHDHLTMHLKGKKHEKKMRWLYVSSMGSNDEVKTYWCSLCGQFVNRLQQMDKHLTGKRHIKELKKKGVKLELLVDCYGVDEDEEDLIAPPPVAKKEEMSEDEDMMNNHDMFSSDEYEEVDRYDGDVSSSSTHRDSKDKYRYIRYRDDDHSRDRSRSTARRRHTSSLSRSRRDRSRDRQDQSRDRSGDRHHRYDSRDRRRSSSGRRPDQSRSRSRRREEHRSRADHSGSGRHDQRANHRDVNRRVVDMSCENREDGHADSNHRESSSSLTGYRIPKRTSGKPPSPNGITLSPDSTFEGNKNRKNYFKSSWYNKYTSIPTYDPQKPKILQTPRPRREQGNNVIYQYPLLNVGSWCVEQLGRPDPQLKEMEERTRRATREREKRDAREGRRYYEH